MPRARASHTRFAPRASVPAKVAPAGDETHLLLEIPADFQKLKARDREAALAWRLAVREAIEPAFARGYAAVEFLRAADGRGAYLLVPQPRRGDVVDTDE